MKREFAGELIGTFILVLFGCGSVAATVLFNAFQGLFQVAIIWGIGLIIAIYITRHLCRAHFNPAVSVAMVVIHKMPVKKLLVYLTAQFAGAFLAGLTLYLFFGPSIASYEGLHNIIRGTAGSIKVAKMFGEYYQIPGGSAVVTMPLAMCAEALGTLLLTLMILMLTEDCNKGRPSSNISPLFIGLGLTCNICLFAPLTQAGFNPARDFGPRLVAWLFGWGSAAFPDQTGGFFFVYVLSPLIGAVIAALLFSKIMEPIMSLSGTKAPDIHTIRTNSSLIPERIR